MAYKRELIAETKNLLTEILSFSNTKVKNGVVYQIIADTREFDTLKVQIFNGDEFVKNWSGNNQQIGKNTLTFTTDVLPTHTRVVFGLNGLTHDITAFAPITLENNTTYTLSMDFINITQGEIAWTNSMLEKNSTATDYVPYGHLSSYKKLLKVADVCQLLDKSKYPATGMYDGVVYTNNGDGTITLNGTATAITNYNLQSGIQVIEGHKYLSFISDDNIDRVSLLLYSDDYNVFNHRYLGVKGSVTTCLKTYNNVYYQIKVSNGASVSNLIVKPQLYDLTEMYGAGNEPKTVAEFKAKFPNALYDYSPRCWVKAYKTGLITQTKNLFNINALTPYTPETLPRGMAGVYNGNIISKGKSNDTACSTGKTLRELCPDLVAGETYILNFETNVPSSVGGQYESIHLRGSDNWWRLNKRTITEADLSAIVFIYAETDGATYTTWNFQIEKGTTATDYVPYGYL